MVTFAAAVSAHRQILMLLMLCLSIMFPVNAMMQHYKYGSRLNISQTFGQLLKEILQLETVDLIIPMPMHPARLKEHGFNKGLVIAKVLTKNHKEKIDFNSVQR